MDFQTYERAGETIRATEHAFRVLYEQQGFRPVKKERAAPKKGGGRNDEGGRSSGDHDDGDEAGAGADT